MTRYLSGLCVAGLGLCRGGLLAVAGFAGLFGVTIGRVSDLYADARSDVSLAGTADRENSCS